MQAAVKKCEQRASAPVTPPSLPARCWPALLAGLPGALDATVSQKACTWLDGSSCTKRSCTNDEAAPASAPCCMLASPAGSFARCMQGQLGIAVPKLHRVPSERAHSAEAADSCSLADTHAADKSWQDCRWIAASCELSLSTAEQGTHEKGLKGTGAASCKSRPSCQALLEKGTHREAFKQAGIDAERHVGIPHPRLLLVPGRLQHSNAQQRTDQPHPGALEQMLIHCVMFRPVTSGASAARL